MKKLKKNDLSLDKEVITSLSSDNLDSLRGGIITPPYGSGNDCSSVELETKKCPTEVASCKGFSMCPNPIYTKECPVVGRPVTY